MPPQTDPTSPTHPPPVTMSISSTSSSMPSLCHDANSRSPSSSSTSSSPTSAHPPQLPSIPAVPRSKSISHLLMPYPPPDAGLAARAAHGTYFRRQLNQVVFGGVDVDWRSLPAIEDCELICTHLLERPHLRCHASAETRLRIIEKYRSASKPTADAADHDVPSSRLQRLRLGGLPRTAVHKLKAKSKAAAGRCAHMVKPHVKSINATADGVTVVDTVS